MRDQVLKEVHSQGHFGRDKTLSLLQQMYFWYGMDKDVTKFVQSCLVCVRTTTLNHSFLDEGLNMVPKIGIFTVFHPNL